MQATPLQCRQFLDFYDRCLDLKPVISHKKQELPNLATHNKTGPGTKIEIGTGTGTGVGNRNSNRNSNSNSNRNVDKDRDRELGRGTGTGTGTGNRKQGTKTQGTWNRDRE